MGDLRILMAYGSVRSQMRWAASAACAARQIGLRTCVVVGMPFGFEGPRAACSALESLCEAAVMADLVVPVRLQGVLRRDGRTAAVEEAYALADAVMHSAADSLLALDAAAPITPAPHWCSLGAGEAIGAAPAREALRAAIASPLLDRPFRPSSPVRVLIECSEQITDAERAEFRTSVAVMLNLPAPLVTVHTSCPAITGARATILGSASGPALKPPVLALRCAPARQHPTLWLQ